MNWYTKVLKDYANFSGRARRTEFWMFVLVNTVVVALLAGLWGAFRDGALGVLFLVLYVGYALAVLVPTLAVSVRRLHDTNRSGWWWLIGLVPFVGGIVLLVFYVLEGTQGDNQFGADPKAGIEGGAAPAVA
jgi:uncharacterized membrane protein YhaH (DUF805 family)